mgnify:CR=1 FL=1
MEMSGTKRTNMIYDNIEENAGIASPHKMVQEKVHYDEGERRYKTIVYPTKRLLMPESQFKITFVDA